MPQLLGRDAVIAHITAAVERARRAGGGTIVVTGPAGVGTTAAVAEALRPLGAKVARASAGAPHADPPVWWIDDVQRLPHAQVDRIREAGSGRTLVLSGRRPLSAHVGALVREAVRADPASVIDVAPLAPEDAAAAVGGECDPEANRGCAGRLRLLDVVTRGNGDTGTTAVHVAVQDLLADLPPRARDVYEMIAVAGEAPRLAAVEAVQELGADFDGALDDLTQAGLIETDGDRLRSTAPLVGTVVASHVGPARAAGLRAAFAEALAGLAGADSREFAEYVRLAADRLPRDFSIDVLRASAERRMAASDPDGAVADLEVAAALAESATDGGTHDDRARAFETLLALASAQYYAGPLGRAEALLRRAGRYVDAATPSQRDELELYSVYLRADSGRPAEIPLAAGADDTLDHRAAVAVRHLFLADRGDDRAMMDAVCGLLVSFDGDEATPVGRGAAALGRSVRASMAGDLALAEAEAEHGLAIAGESPPELLGGFVRELVRLCTLRGDLAAAQRYASVSVEGRVPRVVEASAIIHGASVAVLRGDLVDATQRAERALAMTRSAPVPRGLVRCAAWVALLSAMRGDVARARSLIAEAGRMFPLEANLLLATIMQLARVQLALREGGPMPPPFRFRLERTEGPSRLLLPTLSARLALQHDDTELLEAALAELDALAGSPPAVALAQRVRALRLIPTKRRREAVDALADSAATLDNLGFAALAAETRLEWAELAAERGDPAARSAVLELVPYFDGQGLDDWGDRGRRLARTLGVRIGGRRGGSGELTRRESEVVDLVVSGLSNAEVAARLFLSERTVETHLQHVYRRLGVDSRLALITRLSAVGGDAEAAP